MSKLDELIQGNERRIENGRKQLDHLRHQPNSNEAAKALGQSLMTEFVVQAILETATRISDLEATLIEMGERSTPSR